MDLETRHARIRLADHLTFSDPLDHSPLEALGNQAQIQGLMLTDPQMARDRLAIFPACLSQARRKARAGGLGKGALFCSLDFENHPCHPDEPPEKPLHLLPSFDLARLVIDYYRTSLDFRFLLSGGADVVFEIARTWAEIHALGIVTSPDEQPVLLDLVHLDLRWAGRMWTMLGHAEKQQDLASRLDLSRQEIDIFRHLAETLPRRTAMQDLAPGSQRLHSLVQYVQGMPHGLLENGQEAKILAILATEAARMTIEDEELCFAPVLPEAWQQYELRLTYRGSKFVIQVCGHEGKMILTEGSAIPVQVNGLDYLLEDEFAFEVS